ncbi:MAG: glycosyltransferase family 2 protein [Thermofilum sp.]
MLSELLILLFFAPILLTTAYYLVIFAAAARRKAAPGDSGSAGGSCTLELLIPVKSEPVNIVSRTVHHALSALGRSCARSITVLSDDDPPAAEELKKAASDPRVRVLRRDEPRGGRTGALDEYFLHHAKSEYVLVLDADAIIGEKALEEVCRRADGCTTLILPWRAYYEERTRVAETMKFITDMGTIVLYLMRSRAGFFAFPLGSGTAFPTKVIREVGGWGPGIVQDDIHIGVKLALAGYTTKVIESASLGILVPSKFQSLKKQQRRWAYGTSEVLSRSLLPLLRAKRMPFWKRIEMIMYMSQPLQTVPLFSAFILAPVVAALEPGVPLRFVLPEVLGLSLATASLVAIYVYLFRKLSGVSAKAGEVLANIGRFAAILTVLSPILSVSALRGLARAGMPFEVTPKGEKEKALRGDSLPMVEALYASASASLSLALGNAAATLVSLALLAAALYALARLR